MATVSRPKYVKKNVRNVAPELRLAVVGEALSRGVTTSDVVGEILSEQWSIPYVPSGEKPMGLELTGQQFILKMPRMMAYRAEQMSRTSGFTESSVIQMALSEHYDIPFQPVRRGRKPRAEETA
jgi:hypothetical protein